MGVKHKRPVGVMANSQIPYAKRLQMQKEATIYNHREDAARTAMKVACVALNDTMGMGFQRLEEIGFQVGENGEVFTMQGPDGKFVKPEEVKDNA